MFGLLCPRAAMPHAALHCARRAPLCLCAVEIKDVSKERKQQLALMSSRKLKSSDVGQDVRHTSMMYAHMMYNGHDVD